MPDRSLLDDIRVASPCSASWDPSSSPARSTFSPIFPGTEPEMAKARERVTVLTFALAVLALIVGSAFAVGYIVGKLLL